MGQPTNEDATESVQFTRFEWPLTTPKYGLLCSHAIDDKGPAKHTGVAFPVNLPCTLHPAPYEIHPLLNCLTFVFLLTAVTFSSRLRSQEPTPAQGSDSAKSIAERVDSGLVGALKFRSIGPAFMAGRIADIALDPKESKHLVRRRGVRQPMEDNQRWYDVFTYL